MELMEELMLLKSPMPWPMGKARKKHTEGYKTYLNIRFPRYLIFPRTNCSQWKVSWIKKFAYYWRIWIANIYEVIFPMIIGKRFPSYVDIYLGEGQKMSQYFAIKVAISISLSYFCVIDCFSPLIPCKAFNICDSAIWALTYEIEPFQGLPIKKYS